MKATGPRVAEIHVLENTSKIIKCEHSKRGEKENVDLERSTFFNPRNCIPLKKRMDVKLTMQISSWGAGKIPRKSTLNLKEREFKVRN